MNDIRAGITVSTQVVWNLKRLPCSVDKSISQEQRFFGSCKLGNGFGGVAEPIWECACMCRRTVGSGLIRILNLNRQGRSGIGALSHGAGSVSLIVIPLQPKEYRSGKKQQAQQKPRASSQLHKQLTNGCPKVARNGPDIISAP